MNMKLNPNNPQEFTMTIEERPNIQHDWDAEYKKQRKDRLTDAIHDYLDDSEVDVSEFYKDMRDIIVEMNTYHKTFAKKAEAALLLLHGKPVVENDESPRSYEYSADISLSDIRKFQKGHQV